MADRLHSIDAMRIVAMGFVVMIHTDPFQGLSTAGTAITFGIKTTGRFAVPFFFLASGYFFAVKTAGGDPAGYVRARARALVSLYVFGLVLAAPTFLAGRLVRAALEDRSLATTATESLVEFTDPVALLYYGTSVTTILWFLPALLGAFLLVSLFVRAGRTDVMLPVAAAFHLVGLAVGTYLVLEPPVDLQIRDALFFGFFYTALGYTIRARRWEPSAARGRLLAGLVGLFAVAQLAEFYLLGYPLRDEPFGASLYAPEYGVTTALLTTTLFLLLLARPQLGVDTPLPSWGRYAAGIYVVHPAVFALIRAGRDVVEAMGYPISETIIWHLLLTPTLFVASWLGYLAADRLRVIEIGGTHWPGGPWLRAMWSVGGD